MLSRNYYVITGNKRKIINLLITLLVGLGRGGPRRLALDNITAVQVGMSFFVMVAVTAVGNDCNDLNLFEMPMARAQ